ncbi:MAG: thioredoxin [Gemmatimonadetes bacterium]|nr:MAG: thioredoxin [Gemmatimonadota bacterium]
MLSVRCPLCLERVEVPLDPGARARCARCERPILLDRPLKVAQEDFDATVLGAPVPVLVDFFAEWCGPCKWVAPLVDEIARDYAGRVLVAKVDTDQAPAVAERYAIRSVPTLILFEGGEERARSVGLEPEKLHDMVRRAADGDG